MAATGEKHVPSRHLVRAQTRSVSHSRRSIRHQLVVGSLCVGALGCGGVDELAPQKALEWGDVTLAYIAVVAVLYDGGVRDDSPDLIAEHSADAVLTFFPECAAATVNGPAVSYNFVDCENFFFGMRVLDGQIDVTYGVEPDPGGGYVNGRVTLEMRSDDRVRVGDTQLLLNGTAYNHMRRGYWAQCQCEKPWTAIMTNVTIDAIGPRGFHWIASEILDRPGSYDLDLGCLDVVAYASGGTVDNELADAEASYARCNLSCPINGSYVSMSNRDGPGVQLQFDGSATAAATPRNDFDPVEMDCVPRN